MELRSFCRLCHARCSVLVSVKDSRVVEVKADPQPLIYGRGSLCPKGLAIPEILYHSKRITYPLIRSGERGSGAWEKITLEKALDFVAKKLVELREKYGPKALLIGLGDPKGLELAFAQRFASVYGTPNITTPGNVCHVPRDLASIYTFGSLLIPDCENQPSLIIIWGGDPHQTHSLLISEPTISSFVKKGTQIVVIDPRKTALTLRARCWVKPKPGSDGFIALGLLKVIVEERLYDKFFVEKWTVGFEKLEEYLRSLSFRWLENQTWVSKKEMEEVARLYTQYKPAFILLGNAVDHTLNAFQTARAICLLRALTGNIDVIGGEMLASHIPITRPGKFMLLKEFPREDSVGDEYVLAKMSAFIPRHSAIKAILEEKPYPIKAAFFIGTNPLITYQNSKKVYEALKKLDFIVVVDLFMTPTAKLADVFLPAATVFEYDEVAPYPPTDETLYAYPRLVQPPGECLPDYQIINELAKKLGYKKYFWGDAKEALDYILEPSGLNFQTFREKRILRINHRYKKYEKEGFRTPSKKIEIYSSRLAELGLEPLPKLLPTPELSREYPLILTSYKPLPYTHSAHKNIPSLRKMLPEPYIEISPETALKLGLKEGDSVYVETKTGKIKQKLIVKEELPLNIVFITYGWSFPEKEDLYGWDEANINVLIEDESSRWTGVGTLYLRGIPCKLYKAEA